MRGPFTLDLPPPPGLARRGEHWWLELDGVEVRLSNLEKVYWPDEGITKGDLLAYYLWVSPWLIPHVAGRPLTLKRMPDGIEGGHFYQKDAPPETPEWMPRCAIEPEDREIDEMLVVDRPAHLLHVVNLGCIELHPMHGRCENYDLPDYMVFDLDPFEPAGFAQTLAVASLVGTALEHLGLRGHPKTSGATGIQVYVPIAEGHTYAETRELTERIGRTILRAAPDVVTMEWSVARRAGRVFVDHNMNRRGASLASVYSVRPLPGAPVSTPLEWDEVAEGEVRPGRFTMSSIGSRLAERGDLFRPVVEDRQSLDDALAGMGVPRRRDGRDPDRVRRSLQPTER